MDEFSYLSVLLSIILGLAVTQILQGFRGLLLSRARVRLYWPTLLWAAVLLVIFVQSWWAMFGLRHHSDWTFSGFAVVLFHTITLYMLAGLVLPDFPGDQPVDLRAHYFAHHGWYFGIALLSVLASLAKDLVLSGSLPDHTNVAFHVAFGSLAACGALVKQELFHKVAIIAVAILFAFYIFELFARLS